MEKKINIYCTDCKLSGFLNRCYVTGYKTKCEHDLGLAYEMIHNGDGEYLKCVECIDKENNWAYITGFDKKCGHDNGWARTTINQKNINKIKELEKEVEQKNENFKFLEIESKKFSIANLNLRKELNTINSENSKILSENYLLKNEVLLLKDKLKTENFDLKNEVKSLEEKLENFEAKLKDREKLIKYLDFNELSEELFYENIIEIILKKNNFTEIIEKIKSLKIEKFDKEIDDSISNLNNLKIQRFIKNSLGEYEKELSKFIKENIIELKIALEKSEKSMVFLKESELPIETLELSIKPLEELKIDLEMKINVLIDISI